MKKEPKINAIGKPIEPKKLECREFNADEIIHYFKCHSYLFWSWGAHTFGNQRNKQLQFYVRGAKFQGWIYLFLNASDLFDIYFVNGNDSIIADIVENVYIFDLFQTIDVRIEKTDSPMLFSLN